jgi:ABC-2 type transport system ATP-binding protein
VRLRGCSGMIQSQLVERFKISENDLSKKIKHFSHGNKQKLGIIQAFLHQPELLILDEPTTGLDPLMQEAFYDLVRETQKQGQTIFFSSHNLPEVEKVCDRVAIIRDGNLVTLESLDNLKRKRFRKLVLTLRHPVDSLELAGADLLEQNNARYVFLVKGDFQKLLRQLADLPLLDIVFPEPELEEVFMTYYRSEELD